MSEEDYKLKDHDLLIAINVTMTDIKKSVEKVSIQMDQKADKTDIGVLHARVETIDQRVLAVETANREDKIRKEELGKVASWGWKIWAKIIAGIFALMTVWSFLQQNFRKTEQPTIIVNPSTTNQPTTNNTIPAPAKTTNK